MKEGLTRLSRSSCGFPSVFAGPGISPCLAANFTTPTTAPSG
jgi:hypothetical protein